MSSKAVYSLRSSQDEHRLSVFPAQSAVPTGDYLGFWTLLDFVLAVTITLSVRSVALTFTPPSGAGAYSEIAPGLCALLFAAVLVLTAKRLAFYAPRPVEAFFSEGKIAAKAASLALAVTMAGLYVSGSNVLTPPTLFASFFLTGAAMLGTRSLRSSYLRESIAAGHLTRNILIIGFTDVGTALADHFQRNSHFGYVLKGFLDDQVSAPEVLGTTRDLESIIRTNFIDEIYVASATDRELVKHLTLNAPAYGVTVGLVPDLLDGIGWNVPVDRIGHLPVLVLHRSQRYPLQRMLKRILDVLISVLGLVLSLPLLVAIAVAVKIDSPGPIFYIGTRVGRKGQPFRCFKFRTMCADAEQRIREVVHLNERCGGPLFKLARDPRITHLGGFLRRYSLDELPQLVNVLRGEMSLVGPRPPAIHEYREYRLEHFRKLDVIPGITGLWQVSARRDPSFGAYIKYDLEYIENWSLALDFEILLRTIPEVLRGAGM